jgi:TnsA endonuclease N terminal
MEPRAFRLVDLPSVGTRFEHSGFQQILSPDMPCFDERGWPTGRMYRPFIEAKDSRLGVGFSVPGAKTGRIHEYLSLLERKIHFLLELKPSVIDFREQYPLYDIEQMRGILARDSELPRNTVMTIDVLVTKESSVKSQNQKPYVGLSVKYLKELTKKATWRRLLREKDFCFKQGWEWTLITENHVDAMRWRMSRRIWRWMKDSDGALLADAAKTIACILTNDSLSAATADERLSSAAERMGCDLNHAYRLVGVAAVLGYVNVDTTQEIGPRRLLPITRG